MPVRAWAKHALNLALSAALVAAVAGCSRSSTPAATPFDGPAGQAAVAIAQADPAQAQPAQRAWSRKLSVIGQPVLAGKTALVLTRTKGGGVDLLSLDLETGRTTFSTPFHPGGTPPGVALAPRTTRTDAGRRLVLVRREDGGPLLAVDVRTGAVVRALSSGVVVDDYGACSDGRDVCWSGYLGDFETVQSPFGGVFRVRAPGAGPTRWNLETGRTRSNDGKEGASLVGEPDLYVTGEGRTSTISRVRGTRDTLWSQSVSLAVAPGADSSYGWSFTHDKRANVYVGALGRPRPKKLVRQYERGEKVAVSYESTYYAVGIDGRTGERLWRQKGADPWCELVRSEPDVAARTLCVVGGSRINLKGRESWDKNLTVELRGIDPGTGEVTWSVPLSDEAATIAYADGKAPMAPHGIVVMGEDGPVALDERSGDLQRVDPATVLLCAGGPDRITVYGTARSAGTFYRPCTPDGEDAAGQPSVFGVAAVEGEGNLRVVSMPGRVVAYRLP